MFYVENDMPFNTDGIIESFYGYNHSNKIADGEFYETKNMSCAQFPLMTPRDRRLFTSDVKDFALVNKFDLIDVSVDTSKDDIYFYTQDFFADSGSNVYIDVYHYGNRFYRIKSVQLEYRGKGAAEDVENGIYKVRTDLGSSLALRFKVNVESDNIWDGKWRTGAYSIANGVFNPTPGCICSLNPIPVVAGQTYIVKTNRALSICFYDSADTVTGRHYKGHATDLYNNRKFTVPDGVTHITFTDAWQSSYKEPIAIKANPTTDDIRSFANIVVQTSEAGPLKNIDAMILKDGHLAIFSNKKLKFKDDIHDFSEHIGIEKKGVQMLSYGAYILIFPYNLYLNTVTGEHGTLNASATIRNKRIQYFFCDSEGSSYNYDTAKPSNPTNGQYWMDVEHKQMRKWDAGTSQWVSLSSTYIGIKYSETVGIDLPTVQSDDFSALKEGDAVFITSSDDAFISPIKDYLKGSIIVKKPADNVIVIKGYLNYTGAEEIGFNMQGSITFDRKIPEMDYVCVSNNRVWGCKYGSRINDKDEEEIVNEIYASKLGDPKNWYVYEGAATDSYTISIGSDSKWTGCIAYNGYPYFFKENVVYCIYGAYPATYQLYTYDVRGVQDGSFRSLCIVNDHLVYKSIGSVVVFDGNSTASISDQFGNEKYYNAVGGSALGRYYISMTDKDGNNPVLMVYDIEKGVWVKEDELRIEEFAYDKNGYLYGRNGIYIYGFERTDALEDFESKETEEFVEWMTITGDLGTYVYDKEYLKNIDVSAFLPEDSEMRIYISYDGGDWKQILECKGYGRIKKYAMSLLPHRHDTFRLKFEGKGDMRLHGFYFEYEEGSDVNES